MTKQKVERISAVQIELSAALVAVPDEAPMIMLVHESDPAPAHGAKIGLPCGPFDPVGHRTLEEGLRRWVREQTGLHLGYVEQLYTFGDRFRDPSERVGGPRPVSVGYVALVRESTDRASRSTDWSDWYRHFPWEDWRSGQPSVIAAVIEPELKRWVDQASSKGDRNRRRDRVDTSFGLSGAAWDNERVLDRYELLYEAGVVAEAVTDQSVALPKDIPARAHQLTGAAMIKDHRRIMATAMGRLRGKIKYRPVIFELMPPTFTLLKLQRAVEGLAGMQLHKQNFRRLVANEGLVEATGQISGQTGGRPAELFRFRRDVLRERPAPGVRIPVRRGRPTA